MKTIYILLISLLVSQNAHSEILDYKSGLKYEYRNTTLNTLSSESMSLAYDASNGDMVLKIKSYTETYALELNKKSRESLVSAINKYNKWNKKASDRGVKLSKEIVKIKPTKYTKFERDQTYLANGREFSVSFVSKSEKKHFLLFAFPKFASDNFSMLKFNLPSMVFSYKQANELKNALTDESIKKFFKNKSENKRFIENEFN